MDSARDNLRNRLYESYVSTHVKNAGDGRGSRREFPVLLGLPPRQKAKILDIGCGSGELVKRMMDLGYAQVDGVDVSSEQVALARARGIHTVVQGDLLEYLTTHEGLYDVITATDVFEHFSPTEVLPALDKVYGALARGGILIAQVPNATSPFFGNYAFGDFTHLSVYTQRSVHQLCAEVGFREVRCHPVVPARHGLVSGVRRLLWSAVSALLKFALTLETGGRSNIVSQNLWFTARKL